ncbi:MAG: hypothetical protein ACPKPY_13095 [Nitrososphaeraceae archaeon]
MYSHVPIAQIIKEILLANKTYADSLKLGIANYTSLAQRIKPEIEKITNYEVNLNTIVVTIKRLADQIQQDIDDKKAANKDVELLEGTRISLTGSIIDIDFDFGMKNIENILSLLRKEFDIKFNIFQTKNQIKVFTENINPIKKILIEENKIPGKIKEGISMINITCPWPENDYEKAYNLLSIVSDILYNNNIVLHNVFFAADEIILILNDYDAAKAYELLRLKLYK